eukprot:CAMPEP_0176124902 /NCGR_PEP_ID=MMETSP0120_2-20121206/62992_1 /TAXON_ID=160619 /ORGANISM="Kryptoperidinium foliaceum, Strain CCMP 1326" /LENGTH=41 /DNA_ID= /DNA_START= /DNA_END= /DNA_ORIENTATION=
MAVRTSIREPRAMDLARALFIARKPKAQLTSGSREGGTFYR